MADLQTAPPPVPSARRRQQVARCLCLALGVALVLPSLNAGFFLDDYLQIAQLEGWSRVPAHPLDLFSFTPRDVDVTERLRDAGVAPYFTAPGLRIAFLRPLSSALIWFDHAMFARDPLPYHVHSVLWYAALLITVAVLLRRVAPGPMGVLALLIFCLDGGHALTVTFLAARNGAVSTTLVLLALLAHIRWRSMGWRAGAVIAPALTALALAGGEMAFGGLAYIVAWEGVYRRPGWRKALVPTVVIAVAYLAVYRLTASGARFSGAYLDPFGAPLDVLRAIPERALDLAGGLLLSSPVDFLSADARLRLPFAVIGLIACVVVAVWLPGALRRMAAAGEGDQARVVRWMGWASVGALLAGTMGLLGDRVLLAAGVGGAAVVAALLRDGWRLFHTRPSRGLAAIGLVLLGFPHLVMGAVALPGKVLLFQMTFENDRQLARNAEIAAPVPARVVIIAIDDLVGVDLPAVRAVEMGLPADQLRWFVSGDAAALRNLPDQHGYLGTTVLSMATTWHRLRRTGTDELQLSTPDGSLFDGVWTEALRARSLPLRRGAIVRTSFMTVSILDDRDGRPTLAAFRFDRSLDDPSLVFLVPSGNRLRRLTWPPVGTNLDLPRWSPTRFRSDPPPF